MYNMKYTVYIRRKTTGLYDELQTERLAWSFLHRVLGSGPTSRRLIKRR